MFLDLGSSFSTFKRDEHQSCDLKWRSSNGKVGNFTQTQQGQGEVLLVGGAFCHWFETYVQVKLKYLTRYGQRETLTPPPISSQETSTPKKVLWLDTCEKKKQRRFLRWTANIKFHVHILSLLSPKNPCSTKFHQLSWLSIHWWNNHPIFLTVNGFSFHIWPLASNFRFGKKPTFGGVARTPKPFIASSHQQIHRLKTKSPF